VWVVHNAHKGRIGKLEIIIAPSLFIELISVQGTLSWNGPNALSSGGKDHVIRHYDTRQSSAVHVSLGTNAIAISDYHSQEVCSIIFLVHVCLILIFILGLWTKVGSNRDLFSFRRQ
jgi:WD40 repeat protein